MAGGVQFDRASIKAAFDAAMNDRGVGVNGPFDNRVLSDHDRIGANIAVNDTVNVRDLLDFGPASFEFCFFQFDCSRQTLERNTKE